MASPPFTPSESTPADNSLVSVFPAAERTFRDIIESWILFEHGTSGHHTFPVITTAERNADSTWEVGSLIYNSDDFEMQIVTSLGPTTWANVISFEAAVPGTTTTAGIFEKATTAELWNSTSDKVVTSDLIETGSVSQVLTEGAPIAFDWDAGFCRTLTLTANRTLGNPTNEQQGTYRNIIVLGNDTTDRTLTFDTQYLGTVPSLTAIDGNNWYLLTIFCVAENHFAVSAKKVL